MTPSPDRPALLSAPSVRIHTVPNGDLLRKQLEFLRAGGDVNRYHSTRTIVAETVAHHSFGVAWLCWLLSEEAPRAELLVAAMAHDIAEHVVGDIPAPTKRALSIGAAIAAMEDIEVERAGIVVPSITEEEKRVLKMADVMDGMLFCIRERGLGNSYIRIIFERYRAYLRGLHPTGRALELSNIIIAMWKEAASDYDDDDGK